MSTSLVGILNITPDSFSDGGLYVDPDLAVEKAKSMVKEGATVIDVGAESTRPEAKTISPEEEWKRLGPVLELLRSSDLNAWISVDTRNPDTAARALLTGVDWINDVSGLKNPKMLEVLQENAVNVVIMHNLGIPADKERTLPENSDIIAQIMEWAESKLRNLEDNGIDSSRVIFDPGIGFGKTAQQSIEIIMNIEKFRKLDVRLMVGHSRKSFLRLFTKNEAMDRDKETCRISATLAAQGIDFLRVHNVKANKSAIETGWPEVVNL